MRKNVEMVERTIKEEKVTFIACDGREFTNEQECKEWEQDYKCTLSKTYNNIPTACNRYVKDSIPCVNDDCRVDFLKPQTEEDITTINSIRRIITGETNAELTFNDINKIIVADYGYIYDSDGTIFNSDWVVLYRLDEYIDRVNTGYKHLIEAFEKEEQEAE